MTKKTPSQWDALDNHTVIRRWYPGFTFAESKPMNLFEFLARREQCAQSPRRKERKNDNDRSIGAAGSIGSSNNLRSRVVILARRVVAFVTGKNRVATRPLVGNDSGVSNRTSSDVTSRRDSDTAL